MEGKTKLQLLRPTPEQAQGPFYPVEKPADQDADLTTIKGKSGVAQGQVIDVMGRVLNTKGEPVAGARLEIWQANSLGRYIHPEDANPAPLDPNFQGYGAQLTGADGRYHFKTVKPGSYTVSEEWSRPPHIHFIITGPKSRLITQMYFQGEPLNDTDPLLNSADDEARLIVKLTSVAGESDPRALMAVWDIILAEM